MCRYEQFPAVQWSASEDQSNAFPGLVCRQLEHPFPGGSNAAWTEWLKIAQLVESLPWL